MTAHLASPPTNPTRRPTLRIRLIPPFRIISPYVNHLVLLPQPDLDVLRIFEVPGRVGAALPAGGDVCFEEVGAVEAAGEAGDVR